MHQISSWPTQLKLTQFHILKFDNSHSLSAQVVGSCEDCIKPLSHSHGYRISVNDRLTKIWLRKADGGIHFHCQIGISPHRRVLNEQTQLMSESKPAFRRAVK